VKSIYAIERKLRGMCSSVEVLKGYMVRENLETPALKFKQRNDNASVVMKTVTNLTFYT